MVFWPKKSLGVTSPAAATLMAASKTPTNHTARQVFNLRRAVEICPGEHIIGANIGDKFESASPDHVTGGCFRTISGMGFDRPLCRH